MTRGRRLGVAVLVAVTAFASSWVYRTTASQPVDDLYATFCAAKAMLSGIDPYGPKCVGQGSFTAYPLTTILAVAPFTPLGFWWGPLTFWSLLAGLLAWALLAQGQVWRLLTLTSMPFVISFMFLQWAPLILAVAFLPGLLPLTLTKPHLGLPVLATHLTRRRAMGCMAFLAVTFAIDPTWPARWLPLTGAFDGFIPALTVWPAGLVLLAAAVRWRTKEARFFLLMALMPQRGLYDLLPLWYLVDTRRQLLILNGLSWLMLALVTWASFQGVAMEAIWASTVPLIYVPLLIKVLRRPVPGPDQALESR